MGTDTQHNQPFWVLDSVRVQLWVFQLGDVNLVGFLDLGSGSVSDEDWLTLPFDDDVLTFWDGGQLDFNLGHSQDISGGSHGGDEGFHGGLGTNRGQQAQGADHEVGIRTGFVGVSVRLHVVTKVWSTIGTVQSLDGLGQQSFLY